MPASETSHSGAFDDNPLHQDLIRPGPAGGQESAELSPLHASLGALAALFGPPRQRSFAVRYWDGTVEAPASEPRFTLVLNRPSALRRMLLPPSELAITQAFVDGDIDVEGDLEAAVGLRDELMWCLRTPATLMRVVRYALALPAGTTKDGLAGRVAATGLRRLGAKHTPARDAAAVRSHYDVGNDFFALWLGRDMVYSCAYFPTGEENIDEAQEAKLEHICRKLRLQSGETLLDIGCGWGSLVRYAAERYGVYATGITLSEPQAALARKRLRGAGLADRVSVEVRDYRDFAAGAVFDKVVSVGMLEHVGRAKLFAYFQQARRLVRSGGLFLAHGIVDGHPATFAPPRERLWRWLWREGAFIQHHVFPDGDVVPPSALVGYAERAGWETRDLESLREHYAATLRHWMRSLEARRDEAIDMVGEETYRVWCLYLSGCAQAFATGMLGVVQVLFSNTAADGVCRLPATRADVYQP
jgi:cyclopropane-fatty-acyl-phospholipid synthase